MEQKKCWKISFLNKWFFKLLFALSILTLLLLTWRESVVRSVFLVSSPRINIIMVESKVGKQNLNLRVACSIESAAFHHPDARLTLYNVNGRNDESEEHVKNLEDHYSNILFQNLNVSEVFEGTPLERWNQEGRISESKHPTEHMSDALRLALLWKHGGLYMDTDTIVIKPFYEFENMVGLESFDSVANGVMAFQKNSSFVYNLMRDFASSFDGASWNNQGPALLTKMLKDACNVSWFETVVNKPQVCRGIRVLPQKAFYPVTWDREWLKLFEKRTNESLDFSQSYAVHLYRSHSRDHLVKPGEGTIVETLFRLNCPIMYEIMLEKKHL